MSRMRVDDINIADADIFRTLLDHFPDMIHSIDEKGNIVYTNKTAERLLGYTRDELLHMNIMQIYAPEVLSEVNTGFQDLKRRGEKTVQSQLQAKDGTIIPVEIRSFSIYDDHDQFLRTFSILRDIRELKELQQSLVHAGRLAAIGELASGVAHDINNPLTVIVLSNEMLQRELDKAQVPDSQKSTKIREFSKDVAKASQSIQKLADHLRTFSRGMAEIYEPVDLHNVISDALFITKNKIQKAGVKVVNPLEKGKVFSRGMPNQLEQVFVNLIGNACDAMEGRPSRVLSIEFSPEDREGVPYWRCDIADTGCGIDEKIVDEIFHAFFTTKEKGKGTGLGLSISRAIARDHKGDITVHSKPGLGTTFTLSLPVLVMEKPAPR